MSSKIGILSDVHGNYDALEAVLTKAKKKGINDFIRSHHGKWGIEFSLLNTLVCFH